MSHKRGIYELTISNNVSVLDWLLAGVIGAIRAIGAIGPPISNLQSLIRPPIRPDG